jgi:hypothetical protein
VSKPAPHLNEIRHQPTAEDLRVFRLITERTNVLRSDVVNAANLAVILRGVCAICYFADAQIHEHHHSKCPRKTGSCSCCFGLLSPEIGDHFVSKCPLRVQTDKHCYVCWFPNSIDNQIFHPPEPCKLFSLKLWYIQSLIAKHGKTFTSQLGDKIFSRENVLDLVKRFCVHFANQL